MTRLTIASILFLLPLTVFADTTPVYKIEKNGKIEYTTKSNVKGAKPAKLPEIGHWKIQTPKGSNATCETHGGINCAVGSDEDGSVVCLDSFKDSAQRFKFECTAAKLQIVHISDPLEDGTFTVSIRNSKSIAAQKSVVTFKPQRMQPGMALAGPEQVEAFGVGDYTYLPKKKGIIPTKVKESQLIVSCDNCG